MDLLGFQNFTLTSSKGHGLWFVIGGFQSFLCVLVSRFVACDRFDIMIDGSEKCRCEGGFST